MNKYLAPVSTEVRAVSVSFADMERLAESIANSGLFGMKNKDQALALMAIAQAEGRHPALAARDYDIIQGRSAKKAEAMLRDFFEAGGKVEWHTLEDTKADATFSHPLGGSARITWDTDRARVAGLLTKDMYKKYPRQMLRSRVVSEGVRTVYPAATSGMYVPEEVSDFDAPRTLNGAAHSAPSAPALAAPAAPTVPHDPVTGEVTPIMIGIPLTRDGKDDWIGWGGRFIAALKQCQAREEAEKWIELNMDGLAECLTNAPKAAASVERAMAATRERLPETIEADATPDFLDAEVETV